MNGLGRRQRVMLSNLVVFGDGRWPAHWKLHTDDRNVLASLVRKGLVTAGHALTDEGAKLAVTLLSPAQQELAANLTARRRSGLL